MLIKKKISPKNPKPGAWRNFPACYYRGRWPGGNIGFALTGGVALPPLDWLNLFLISLTLGELFCPSLKDSVVLDAALGRGVGLGAVNGAPCCCAKGLEGGSLAPFVFVGGRFEGTTGLFAFGGFCCCCCCCCFRTGGFVAKLKWGVGTAGGGGFPEKLGSRVTTGL